MKQVKCKNADRYKAKRKPTCGCDICELKWRLAELERSYWRDKFNEE